MILTKGTKELLVNSAASFPFIFTKPGSGADSNKEVAATAADATHLRIRGYGDFFLAGISGSVLAQRAQGEVIGSFTVDASQASQITVAPNIPAGTTVTIELKLYSIDPLSEFMTNMDKGTYRRSQVYTLTLPAAATALQVLTLLAAQINSRGVTFPEADEPPVDVITASIAGNVLTLTPGDAHVSVRAYVDPSDVYTTPYITVLATQVATPSYAGRGLYRNLKGGRLQTEGTNDPYGVPGPLELAQPGAKYTRVDFATATARPDLTGPEVADSAPTTFNKFGVYIQESGGGNEQAIQDLVNFLSRAGAGVSYFYSDVNQASNAPGTTKALFISNTVV